MPCLDLSTSVSLDGVDTKPFLSEATKALAEIIGRPESYVMILLKGSVRIWFGGTYEPAALGEVIAIGGLTSEVRKKLIATIGTILETKLSVPKTRFLLKFHDTKAGRLDSKM